MKILITGGAGFIGANFIYYWQKVRESDEIVCLDKLTYAANIRYLDEAKKRKNFRFVQGDICDGRLVGDLFVAEKPNVVVNFAAESRADRSIADASPLVRTNIVGTQTLMDCCLRAGVERFHQVSTDEAYGNLPLTRPELSFTEESPVAPSSPYAATKAAADLLALAYFRTHGLAVTISRCSNNYGPFQHREKFIPKTLLCAMRGEKISVCGKGENVRDWLYVEDHCRAVQAVIERGKIGQIYNVGGRNEARNVDVAREICRITGADERLIAFVSNRKGHDLRYAVDPTKIYWELGWLPKVDFDEGLKRTALWYETEYEKYQNGKDR